MVETSYNRNLKAQNTFGMDVSCACYVEYDGVEDLRELYRDGFGKMPAPVLYMGGGSNLLFTRDFPGTVLHSRIRFIREVTELPHGKQAGDGDVFVEVGAGVIFDEFCSWAAGRGYWGVENLSLIPGETGAAAVQNIGAYGVEVKDVIACVYCFDVITGREIVFDVSDCAYGYRDSIFKDTAKGRYIVTSVLFRLSKNRAPLLGYGRLQAAVQEAFVTKYGDEPLEGDGRLTPDLVRSVVISVRQSKLPDPSVTGSAGSFFKNPVVPKSSYDRVVSIASLMQGKEAEVPHYDAGSGFVKIPAAWLIEQCGWKGYREGNAGVYEKQPLVIVNLTGKASPEEIISVERKITESVNERFGILLSPEVEHI